MDNVIMWVDVVNIWTMLLCVHHQRESWRAMIQGILSLMLFMYVKERRVELKGGMKELVNGSHNAFLMLKVYFYCRLNA